jgi:hypothetical protein
MRTIATLAVLVAAFPLHADERKDEDPRSDHGLIIGKWELVPSSLFRYAHGIADPSHRVTLR